MFYFPRQLDYILKDLGKWNNHKSSLNKNNNKVKFDYFMLIFRPLPKGHHQELLQDSRFTN